MNIVLYIQLVSFMILTYFLVGMTLAAMTRHKIRLMEFAIRENERNGHAPQDRR